MERRWRIIKTLIPAAIIIFCFAGFLLAPNDPRQVNVMHKFLEPSPQHPFGTDELGRCVFSRVLQGGYVTLGIVLIGSACVLILGTFAGLTLGYIAKGRTVIGDSVLNAITAIPPIAYLIIFIGIWGNSIPTMMVALTASLTLRLVKLVKARTGQELGKAYIMCAISSGASGRRVLFGHVLPNSLNAVIHYICLSCADMVMAISGFSFIGLSLGNDVIDWGTMLASARSVMAMRPALLFYPILFIFLSTVAFHLLAVNFEEREDEYAGY